MKRKIFPSSPTNCLMVAACFLLAAAVLTACTAGNKAGEGAVIGGVTGVGAGVVVGGASGRPAIGGVVGGATGAILGGAVGDSLEEKANAPEYDAMLERQQKEIDRQRQELEDIERQRIYDEKYRQYENSRSP